MSFLLVCIVIQSPYGSIFVPKKNGLGPVRPNLIPAHQLAQKRLLQDSESLFEAFKKAFDLEFPPEEESLRKANFITTLKKIYQHNSTPGLFKMGINEFAALSDKQFKARYLEQEQRILDKSEVNTQPPPEEVTGKSGRRLQGEREPPEAIIARLAKKIDWSSKGKISPIKHQKVCQACYVFSAIAGLEAAIALKWNVIVQLSEQEIVDCSYSFKNNGCVGGQPAFVYDYALANGLNLQSNYEYEAVEKQCKAPTFKPAFKQTFKYFKPELNVLSIMQYLQYGPVVVNHYAPDSFKYYFSGIFQTADCNFQTIINHSSLIVGYDLTAPQPYFLIKNSWGVKWGERGFYKVLIGDLNYDNPGFCFLASNGYNVFPTYF